MSKLFIKPRSGLIVRDPLDDKYRPLPAEGKHVERSTYWLRRLSAGDVVEAEPPRKAKAAPKDKSTPKSEDAKS